MDVKRIGARMLKPAVFVACLLPAAWILYDYFLGELGPNPIEEITHRTGISGLVGLLVTLAITPLKHLFGWSRLIRYRRMLGLFAFFYVTLHFLTYLVLDQFFAFDLILEDVGKRPYITLGFTAFVLLISLAVTSTKKMIKRMGGKRWNRLHSLIYLCAGLGVIHYLWLVKADTRDPTILGAILVVLLGYRLYMKRARKSPRRRQPPKRSQPPQREERVLESQPA